MDSKKAKVLLDSAVGGRRDSSTSNSDASCSGSDYGSASPSGWWALPEPVLLRILRLLPISDILRAGATCRRWCNIARDDMLWKRKFQRHYKVDPHITLKPGAESWKTEYRRLTTHIPFVQSQRLEGHTHQVLHVSFSHNGEMFATSSKDGYVIIWNSKHPCTEKYSHNMKVFSWKYTQYSQFNQSDTLLLVSGVHFGSPHSTSGEIAVFTVDNEHDSYLRCRVLSRPYDIFGTWFSDQYLISGDLHWLAHLVSTSVLWLNKANQEIDSEHVPVMNQLYKFYNKNASSVRSIMMAKCPWLDATNDPLAMPETNVAVGGTNDDTAATASTSSSAGNPLSRAAALSQACPQNGAMDDCIVDIAARQPGGSENPDAASGGDSATIRYLDEYRREYQADDANELVYDECDDDVAGSSAAAGPRLRPSDSHERDKDVPMEGVAEDELDNSLPKYLIFSTGSKTYTPHQVGIKRIRNINFPKKLDPGLSLRERIAAKAAEKRRQPPALPDWWNYDAVADRFDKVDKVIDLHGHIIGMALSPDHRYLYVNTRPWPANYVISNALEPPPIAQEIDIHVIDLMTLKRVGNMLRAHKAYTPSTECFFIFLDVCEDFVASGAEDMHAYLWDRYYGVCLAKYKHTDVVNSVAFNPRDPEMLVTTSDDYTIKIWRSRARAKALNIDAGDNSEAFEFKTKVI